MFMKTQLSVAATALALGSLTAACGGTSGDSAATGSGGKKKLTVAFVAALVNDSYFITVKCGAQAEAKKLGVDFKWVGPASNDVSKQKSAFAATAATNPDAMVLAPFSNTGFGGMVRPLMKKGVPVTLSGQSLEPADGLVTYITDFLAGGNSLADEIGTLSGGTGTMAIVADTTGNKTDSDRYTGLVPMLKQQYPKLKVLSPQYAQNSTAKGASITASLIQANPSLKLVYATSGPEAAGAASAIAAAKAADRIKLISFDSNSQQIKLLKENKLAATVAQSPYLSGQLSTRAAVEYARAHAGGGAVPASADVQHTPTMVLTPQNVNTPEAQQYQYLEDCSQDKTQGGS
jgi:ribose transport system substrate-binding protein